MDLLQLKLFAEIARQGSLTKCSISLDMEQSLISRQIAALETEVGGRLFHRTGRGMTLTEMGANVLPRVQSLLDYSDQVVEEIKSEAGVLSGEVRLGILPAFSYPVLNRLYRQIKKDHPQVRLQFFEGSNGQLSDWIANGRIDIAVLYRYRSGIGSEVKALGSSDACLICRADDPLAREGVVPFEELRGLPLILPSAPNHLRDVLAEIGKTKGFALNVVAEADSMPIQKDMVLEGEAYAVLGAQAILRERSKGALAALRIVEPGVVRTAVLAMTPQKPLSQAMRAVGRAVEPLVRDILDLPDKAAGA